MNRKWFLSLLMLLVFMPVLAVAVLALTNSFEVKQLGIFGTIPPFELTERAGDAVTREDLNGKVWVAGFVFTHCSGQCPLLSAQMKKIQDKFRLKERFRLVSISVDPERDTPDLLKEYAKRFGADTYKWLFLTGEKNEIQTLVQHGFRLASSVEGEDSSQGDIIHSFKLVLVDWQGRIRGYYDGLEDVSVRQLIRDARGLIRQAF